MVRLIPLAATAIALIALAVFLRCFHLGSSLFFSDEAFSWRVASFEWGYLLRACAADTPPPMHFVMLKLWIGVFGDSLVSMRSLSVLFSILTLVVAVLICHEAEQCTDTIRRSDRESTRDGTFKRLSPFVASCLLATCVLAIHPVELTYARMARMYATGAFFSLFSAFALLRASRTTSVLWWMIYGVAAGLLCLTHTFGFLTVAAQAAFVIVAWRKASRWSINRSGLILGFLVASAVGITVYSPWMATVLVQWQRVHADFWVPTLTFAQTQALFTTWSTGLDGISDRDGMVWTILSGCIVALMLTKAARADWLLALMALIPWSLVLFASHFLSRPLLQERFLLFALAPFIIAFARLSIRFERLSVRLALIALLVGPVAAGALIYSRKIPKEQVSMDALARFLQAEYRDGDLVLVGYPFMVNCTRFYWQRYTDRPIEIKYPVPSEPTVGHINHVASLLPSEVLVEESPPLVYKRVWVITLNNDMFFDQLPSPWRFVDRRSYAPSKLGRQNFGESHAYTLDLYSLDYGVHLGPT